MRLSILQDMDQGSGEKVSWKNTLSDLRNTPKEELIAECGASFLCGYTGIVNDTIENQAAYIEHWRKQLAADKKLVITAPSCKAGSSK